MSNPDEIAFKVGDKVRWKDHNFIERTGKVVRIITTGSASITPKLVVDHSVQGRKITDTISSIGVKVVD